MFNLLEPDDIDELIYKCADAERNSNLPTELRLTFCDLDSALTKTAIRLRDYKAHLTATKTTRAKSL